MTSATQDSRAPAAQTPRDELELLDLAWPLLRHWRLLVLAPLALGAVVLALSFLLTPVYTARTTMVAPQQSQGGFSGALAALGSLSGLGGGAALRSASDLHVALMQSRTVSDRIIDRFNLRETFKVTYQFEAREALAQRVRITLGKKDGLIAIEVDDTDPQRAADIANRYVVELRELTGQLTLTEAQRRRVFFDEQLKQTRDRLTRAQQALQGSGFGQGALRAEPQAAAEEYGRLRAEITASEMRLLALQRSLHEAAPEVAQQRAALGVLRSRLAAMERTSAAPSGAEADYVSRYREFKYQETLFDLLARQYEVARLDESREDLLVQVVDPAQRPEWKSRPKRALMAVVTWLLTLLGLTVFLIVRFLWRDAAKRPARAAKLRWLQSALDRS